MGELSQRVSEFVSAEPIATHDGHGEYLDNLEVMLRAAAVMFGQDAQIAGTWLRKRRPKKGRFIHLRERIAFARRTKAHGRHGAKALSAAAEKVRKVAEIHEEFRAKEETLKKDGDDEQA